MTEAVGFDMPVMRAICAREIGPSAAISSNTVRPFIERRRLGVPVDGELLMAATRLKRTVRKLSYSMLGR